MVEFAIALDTDNKLPVPLDCKIDAISADANLRLYLIAAFGQLVVYLILKIAVKRNIPHHEVFDQ